MAHWNETLLIPAPPPFVSKDGSWYGWSTTLRTFTMHPRVMSSEKVHIYAEIIFFLLSKDPKFSSNKHTNIHYSLYPKRVFCRPVETVWYSHEEIVGEECWMLNYLIYLFFLLSQNDKWGCLRGVGRTLTGGTCFSYLTSWKKWLALLSRLALNPVKTEPGAI